MNNMRWIKCYVMHKDDSPCGHEIISPFGKPEQAFCPVCTEGHCKKVTG